jgi:hypothetical protein
MDFYSAGKVIIRALSKPDRTEDKQRFSLLFNGMVGWRIQDDSPNDTSQHAA